MDVSHPKYNPDFLPLRPNPAAGDGEQEYFACGDGVRMFVQYWRPAGAVERVVVCLHGMNAHGWYYSMMADALAPAGVAVYVPDYRGHGLSDGVTGDLKDARIVVEDIRGYVAAIRERHPGARIFILGESMGGAVAINLALDEPNLAGLILIAPAVRVAMNFSLLEVLPLPFYLLSHLINPRWRVISVTGREDKGMRNPLNIKYDRDDPLHHKFVTPRYVLGVKGLMDRAAAEGPPRISIPALIFQGGRDTGISPEGVREFYEKLASRDKTFKYYPEAFHCMQTDPDCADMKDIARDWVTTR